MTELFRIAEKDNIEITYCSLPSAESVSVRGDKGCYIGVDYSLLWKSAEERVHVAHELGHCETGSFYNLYSPFDIRAKHEHRANVWAIKKLLPKEELIKAVEHDDRNIWDIADEFGVTVPFLRKAIDYYKGE